MSWLSRLLGRLAGAGQEPPGGESAARIKSRPIMDRVLKQILVPEVRARGFTGSFPHFRRIRPDRIDLLTVQYTRRGGQFMVELAQCGPAGIATEWGKQIAPDKVTVHDTLAAGDRSYLTFKAGWRGKVFVFDRPSYDPPLFADEAGMEASCVKTARTALEAFTRQAEPWWEQKAASKDADRA